MPYWQKIETVLVQFGTHGKQHGLVEPEVTSSSTTVSTEGGSWDSGTHHKVVIGSTELRQQLQERLLKHLKLKQEQAIRTSVVEEFVESRNDRIVSISVIPFCRARTIEIDAQNLNQGTRHYVYFDAIKVDEYVRPFS